MSKLDAKALMTMYLGGSYGYEIHADELGQVTYIHLNYYAVNKMFNAENISAEDFGQSFLNNYGRHTSAFEGRRGYWEYRNTRDGYRVVLSSDKDLVFEVIGKVSDLDFD